MPRHHRPLSFNDMNAIAVVPDRIDPALANGLADASLDRPLVRALWALVARQGLALGVKQADDGRYLLVNPALTELLGRSADKILGCTDGELLEPGLSGALRSGDHTALAQNQPLASEHRFELRGQRREFQVLRVVADGAAAQAGRRLICSVWTDLAPQRQRDSQLRLALDQLEQQQKANDQLRAELAGQPLRDQASGLYSRAHFDDQMRRELDLSAREHREFALVYMALDPYTDATRSRGLAAHDRICEAMGRLLRGNTRAMDASCRLDDTHFAVLLSGVGLATAHSRMEGLRRQCATQIVMLDGAELSFSVAMGVASFPHTAHSHDELVATCTSAMAEARRRGGNTVALATIRFDAL